MCVCLSINMYVCTYVCIYVSVCVSWCLRIYVSVLLFSSFSSSCIFAVISPVAKDISLTLPFIEQPVQA